MKLHQVIKSEFKDIKSYNDFKTTVTSLNNLFYGMLLVSIILLLSTAPGLFLIPTFFIIVAYVGRLIEIIINFIKSKIKQNEPPRS
jgi:hypothetical protein